MPLPNQSNQLQSISLGDLRSTLLIIEKGAHYKDPDILQSILGVAFYMPSNNHALYEQLQVYQGGLYERILDNTDYFYDDTALHAAKEALYKHAYGNFNEALWLIKQDIRSATAQGLVAHPLSSVIRPEYFTKAQRATWNALQKELLAARQGASNTLAKG